MISRLLTLTVAMLLVPAFDAATAQDTAAVRKGGEVYRACVGCHSLRPDVHLTGPSLAEMFGRRPGLASGFSRYSDVLKKADLTWNQDTLDGWLADPQALVPNTYMIFRGIEDDRARRDLIAFLEKATALGGDQAVVAEGLIPQQYAEGQMPEPLKNAAPGQQVTAVRHCGDSYFITTADGTEIPFWEMNLRLKLDTRSTGPEPGRPVIAGGGMMGDRASLVFSSVAELTRFVVEKC